MKNTKANILELLEVKYKFCHRLANYCKESGDMAEYTRYISCARVYIEVIELFGDKEFFNRIVEIFKEEMR